jgi:hypothetical protein
MPIDLTVSFANTPRSARDRIFCRLLGGPSFSRCLFVVLLFAEDIMMFGKRDLGLALSDKVEDNVLTHTHDE